MSDEDEGEHRDDTCDPVELTRRLRADDALELADHVEHFVAGYVCKTCGRSDPGVALHPDGMLCKFCLACFRDKMRERLPPEPAYRATYFSPLFADTLEQVVTVEDEEQP